MKTGAGERREVADNCRGPRRWWTETLWDWSAELNSLKLKEAALWYSAGVSRNTASNTNKQRISWAFNVIWWQRWWSKQTCWKFNRLPWYQKSWTIVGPAAANVQKSNSFSGCDSLDRLTAVRVRFRPPFGAPGPRPRPNSWLDYLLPWLVLLGRVAVCFYTVAQKATFIGGLVISRTPGAVW